MPAIAVLREHGEDHLGGARGVGCMLQDLDRAFIVQQAVEHIGRLAFRCLDQPGIERGVAVGDEAVQCGARRGAVLGVVVADSLAAAAGGEELSIRGRGAAVAPDCSEGLSMLGVDGTVARLGVRRRSSISALVL